MRCDDIREAVSARLDGEELPVGVDAAAVDRHLATCTACAAHAAAAERLHRQVRVRSAEPVPDLVGPIMAAAPDLGRPAREWPRYALLAVALTQLVLALPALLLGDDPGASIHVARELGSFDVALAVGLLWAAWQPRRAAGLLPMAAALAGTLIVTAVLDAGRGQAPVLGEAHHVLDLCGVALLWLVANPTRMLGRLLPSRRAIDPTLDVG
jgi:predicted anti-sigma-YlaC factor YlaD